MGISWQTLSFAIIVVASLVFIGLERWYPYDRGQRLFRKGFFVDFVGYSLFQSFVLGLAIAAIIGVLHSLPALSGLHVVTSWPVPWQLFFFFVTMIFTSIAFTACSTAPSTCGGPTKPTTRWPTSTGWRVPVPIRSRS